MNWEAYVNCLPWFNYDGSTGAHRFAYGDINWGQHHYDIVQWGVGADDTGPVEIRLEDGKPVFRYANGVEVFGCPPPGSAWDEGGACFVGTEGKDHRPPRQVLLRSARNRQGNARHGPYRRLLFDESLGQLPGVRPHPAANDKRRGDRALPRPACSCWAELPCVLGRTLKWDPQTEEFPDEPDANRLLSMAAREPWRY